MVKIIFLSVCSLIGLMDLVLGTLEATGFAFADRGTDWATWAMIIGGALLFLVAGSLAIREIRHRKV
jgi:arginine exporter protein ArgO